VYSRRVVVVLQRRVPPVAGALLAAALVASLIAALDVRGGGHLFWWLALVPHRVWEGELWRLVTWVLVQPGPMSLVFFCVTLFHCGGELEWGWGTRYFASRLLALVVLVGLVTLAVVAVAGEGSRLPYLGGRPVTCALIIAWALQYPERRVAVYGVLVVGGRTLAHGTLLVVLLFTAYVGVVGMTPELAACAAALLYMHGAHLRLARALRRARARRRRPRVVR
jgi:membrane associated rhomboid family serine protease